MTDAYVVATTGASLDAAGTAISVSTPPGTQVGMLLELCLTVQSNVAMPALAGWTLAHSAAGTTLSWGVYRRTATDSEPATQSFTGLTSLRYTALLSAFNSVDTTTPGDIGASSTSGTTALVAFNSVTPVTALALIVARRLIVAGSGTWPASYTSSNMAVQGMTTGQNASQVNSGQGLATQQWAGGAFTPNLVPAGVSVTQNRATTYALRPATQVTRARTGAGWNVGGTVTASRTGAGWAVRSRVTAQRDTAWAVPGQVVASRATSWAVLAQVTRSRTGAGWNVTGRVVRSRGASWAVLTPVVAGAIDVTVDVGTWSQSWSTGEDIDAELVAANGMVLDQLTAEWAMPDLYPSQPDPVQARFRLYVPAAASSRPVTVQGTPVRIVVTPSGTTTSDEYPPVLEFHGRISDGDATPVKANSAYGGAGLVYDVYAVEYRAELAGITLGGTTWPEAWLETATSVYDGSTLTDGACRMDLIVKRLAGEGITFEWDPFSIYEEGPLTGPNEGFSQLAFANGRVPARPRRPQTAVELLEEHMVALIKLSATHDLERGFGRKSSLEDWTTPDLEDAGRNYTARPYVCQRVSEDGAVRYGVTWATPRIDKVAGLPLRLELTDTGTLGLVPRPDALLDDATRGTWLPASAVSRAIVWRVDKAEAINRALSTGWFIDFSSDYEYGYNRHSKLVPKPEGEFQLVTYLRYIGRQRAGLGVRDGFNEVTIPNPIISPPEDQDAIREGLYVGTAYLGKHYDAEPRYAIDSIKVLPRRLADRRTWPRWFPQAEPGFYGGHVGRFVFVHSIPPAWHPEGRTWHWGQLRGAKLELRGGQLELEAQLTHRLPGPNGPHPASYVPPPDRYIALDPTPEQLADPAYYSNYGGPRYGAAARLEELAPNGFGAIAIQDVDDSVRIADLALTSAT